MFDANAAALELAAPTFDANVTEDVVVEARFEAHAAVPLIAMTSAEAFDAHVEAPRTSTRSETEALDAEIFEAHVASPRTSTRSDAEALENETFEAHDAIPLTSTTSFDE